MPNPPRIWLDYRPVRIGWVIGDRDVAKLATAASWNACLWGGRHNCVIPAVDLTLADRLVSCFGVDVLIPVQPDDATAAFINRFPHLEHQRWHDSIFHDRGCEFADIRHALRRISAHQDRNAQSRIALPSWDESDPLGPLWTLMFGRYPAPNDVIADYQTALRESFSAIDVSIPLSGEVPQLLLENFAPLSLTGYDLARTRSYRGRLGPGVVLASATDFDSLLMFYNLRAAGASLAFYDQSQGPRLKPFVNAFLAKLRSRPSLDEKPQVTFWIRRDYPRDDSWKPDLDIGDLALRLSDGRGETLWNGMNVKPTSPHFSASYRDVVPSYTETGGQGTNVSFGLPGRPFDDDDIQSSSQKFAVVVDANQYGEPAAELTFETPFAPRLNEFYGRNFHHDYDGARSQLGRLDQGAVAIITSVSSQRLQVNAFHVSRWIKAFLELCQITIERSEAGLRCNRLIAQLGGLQACRVLKIRGVRNLLRKYGVDEHYTRSGALDAIRDVDPASGAIGFDAFKRLFIEYRETNELKPDDVLRYLLERRVFRVGLEFTCPNCQLPGWLHLDDVQTNSTCSYCDHRYDVSSQLKDRDWRYRRSGIFGRDDNQLGGVPVAVTLQQLSTSLRERFMMYSTAINFRSLGADIEPCESDFVAIVGGTMVMSEPPLQVVFGEAKTEGSIDAQDVRKLGKLADAIPRDLAKTFILFSKTTKFSAEEVQLAKTLNSQHNHRVILWTHDELEPYYTYERSRERLGERSHAGTLNDMVQVTNRLYGS